VTDSVNSITWHGKRIGVITTDESMLRMARKWQARRGGGERVQVAARNRPELGPRAREKMERADEAE